MVTNATALTRILLSERPSLLRVVQRIVGNMTAAEDVTQALWLRIQRIEDDPPIINGRSFLFRLASNLAIDHVRAEQTRARIQAEAHAFLWNEVEAPDAQRLLSAEGELARILEVARTLPEPTRTIFHMNRFEGVSQSEIAVRRGVSVTTVEKHVRRALDALRKVRDEA